MSADLMRSPEAVADAVALPLLASMRPEPRLAEHLDRGEFRPRPGGPLTDAATTCLNALAATRRGIPTGEPRSPA